MLRHFLFPIAPNSPANTFVAQAEFIRYFEPEKVYLLFVASGEGTRHVKNIEKIEEKMRKAGLPVERLVHYGHIPTEIVMTAAATKSTICFTKKWKNPLKKALIGSVVSDVVRMSGQPVLIYKKNISRPLAGGFFNSMYATDFKHSDKTCIRYIQHPAFKAENLILLHVGQRAPDPVAEKKRLEHVHADLDRLASECRHNFRTIEKREIIGLTVAHKILRKARIRDIDLLVIGKIDAQGIFTRFTGSTAEAVYNRANCSVLIIPSNA
jgi:nucleotide-binding universal stress UspA family protein